MAARTLRILTFVSSTATNPGPFWPKRRAGWRMPPRAPSRSRIRGGRRAHAGRLAAAGFAPDRSEALHDYLGQVPFKVTVPPAPVQFFDLRYGAACEPGVDAEQVR